MERPLRRDTSGVASTVATMLSLLVMLLFLDLALVEIVPRQENDAEFITTQTAIAAFQQLHGLAQGAAIPIGTGLSPGITVGMPLGTLGVSPLQPPTTGTLSFDPTVTSSKLLFQFVPHFNSGAVTHVDQDIILAIDSSGSMSTNDPTRLRISGAKEYIGRLSCPDHVAVVDFDDNAFLTKQNVGGAPHHLTSYSHNCFPDYGEAKTDVDTIDSSGSTNYGAALLVANNEMLGYGDPDHAHVIILLTDGYNTCCPNQAAGDALAQQQARRARDNGIVVFTIGLGNDVDTAMLQYIADTTGGSYYPAPTAASIRWIYFEISRHFAGSFACGDISTSEAGGGRLSLELRNREFPGQTISYESGGIVQRQSDGTRVVSGPGVKWTSAAPKGSAGTLTVDVVVLEGREFRVDGSETQLVSVRPESRDLEDIAIVKVNLTGVSKALDAEIAYIDYWTGQGAATLAGANSVKTPINLTKAALASGQSKQIVGNLTSARTYVDSASAQLTATIAAAQNAATAGTMQQWFADAITDAMLLQACYLTQWVNWYEGISIEITSADAAAWVAWMARTAAGAGMQYIVSQPGGTAVLQIRAVDHLFLDRRVLSVSMSS